MDFHSFSLIINLWKINSYINFIYLILSYLIYIVSNFNHNLEFIKFLYLFIIFKNKIKIIIKIIIY